jgi:hypothetical protein
MSPKLLPALAVAERYGQHPHTLKRKARSGEFPMFVKLGDKRGSRVMWREADLDFYDELLLGRRRATS